MAAEVLFSIIVPTRNRLDTLVETLEGIRQQDFDDYEVIVVDDGSSTETRAAYPALWKSLGERFRLVIRGPDSHPGSGPSKARNAGIEVARGEFITFCDDDDRWCGKDHLAVAARSLRATPWCRLYLANQIGVLDGCIKISNWFPEIDNGMLIRKQNLDPGVYEIAKKDIVDLPSFAHLNITIVKRDLVNEIGGFWTKISYEEDRDFFWRCLDHVDRLLIRRDIISIHNIPLPKRQDNVSTQITQIERWLGRGLVCRHVAISCLGVSLVRQAVRLHGDTLRHLVGHLEEKNRTFTASRLARASLACRFSMKWAFYTVYLNLREAVRSKRHKLVETVPSEVSPVQDRADGTATQAGPMFSIIVPTRNRPDMLEQTLMGIHAQTFRNFEVVVVDDGSSEEVRKAYVGLWGKLDKCFRLVTLGPPDHFGSGPSKTRNVGIAAACGQYVTFCDDDDYWCDRTHLAVAARALTQRKSAMYIGNQRGLSNGSEIVSDWLPELTSKLRNRPRVNELDVYELPRADLVASRAFPHLNILMVHRDIVQDVGGFWERALYEGDLEFFWRCLDRVDKVLFRPMIVSAHNIPDKTKQDNVSTRFSQIERWVLRATNCRHVLLMISCRDLARRVLSFEADTLRHLSVELAQMGRYQASLSLAAQALNERFSFKWCVFVLFMGVRTVWNRLVPMKEDA
jgi:glycosyltransferase involved in cell wall biosynthesis